MLYPNSKNFIKSFRLLSTKMIILHFKLTFSKSMISRLIYSAFIFFFSITILGGQIKGYITIDAAEKGEINCDIRVLNGLSLKNPDYIPPIPPAIIPELPCGKGGNLDNFIIYPFIAPSNEIELIFRNQNCVTQAPFFLTGLQAGITSNFNVFSCVEVYENGNLPATSTSADFMIKTAKLIPGNKYYLFVDGNGGASCTYDLEVRIPTSNNPTLKDIGLSNKILDSIIVNKNRTTNTSLCAGPFPAILKIPNGSLRLSYKWIFDTVIDTFPLIYNTNVDSLRVRFLTMGTYNVKVVATNSCSDSDTMRLRVKVEDANNTTESFGQVLLCNNASIGPFIDSLNQVDPNGDGIFGWRSDPPLEFKLGIQTGTFMSPSNCKIQQRVELLIRDAAVGVDTVTVCGRYSDGFNDIDSTQSVRYFPGILSNGCDSSVMRYVIIPDIRGTLTLNSCDVAKPNNISFNPTYTSLPKDATLRYTWKDALGNTVTDSDNDSTNLILSQAGKFYLAISVITPSLTCLSGSIDSISYDPSSLVPINPSISGRNIICMSSTIDTIVLSTASSQLLLPGGVLLLNKINSNSYRVDYRNVTSDSVIINALDNNICGTSDTSRFKVIFLQKPNLDFILPSTICVSSNIDVIVNGSATRGYTYGWNISGGLLSGGDTSLYQNISLLYGSAGVKPLILQARNPICGVLSDTKSIIVVDRLRLVPFSCSSTANSIDLTWPTQACVTKYVIFSNGDSVTTVSNGSVSLKSLQSNTDYMINVKAVNDCVCPDFIMPTSCKTIDCSLLQTNTELDRFVFCSNERNQVATLKSSIISGQSGGIITYSGLGVASNGKVTVSTLIIGRNDVYTKYELGGCIKIDTLDITRIDTPKYQLLVEQPKCNDELRGSYRIAANSTSNWSFTLNGNSARDSGFLMPGSYSLIVTDQSMCSSQSRFIINQVPKFEYTIEGSTEIYEDEILKLSFVQKGQPIINLDSFNWAINDNIKCINVNCNKLAGRLEAGTYKSLITIKYGNCLLKDSLNIAVLETPKVYTSNVISFNSSDEANKTFVIKTNSNDVKLQSLRIFSRWGEIMYQQDAPLENMGEAFKWNGKYNGENALPGVYAYSVEFLDKLNRVQVKRGSFTIL